MATVMQRPAGEGPGLPAGTVTFLLTDVEGSTRLWEDYPEAMSDAITRHDSLMAAIVERHGGLLLKTRGEGDSAFIVFREAQSATACALDLQLTFCAKVWPEDIPLRVRMALHTGEAELREGDYFGPVVNRCARLRAIGYGQQAILSHATASLVREQLPEGASLRDLGVHRLKDLDVPENVYQLQYPDLPAEFPPLKSLTVISNNLPALVTSFVGREQEVAEVKKLLDSTRLLTLSGAGGLGKTRLAIEIASDLIEHHPNGVWLVELAPITEPSLVLTQVAQAVGVREEAARTLLESLVEHLRSRKLLFVLDNCEHLISACAELMGHLLRLCPEIKVLATSREPLGIDGETVWRLRPLSLPDPREIVSVESLMQYDAVKLFVERALQGKSDFQMSSDNAAAVAQICLRLDGVPLAIELAAARVKVLTPVQINERMGDRFRLLTSGSRGAPTRQQTLRAAIDWSYDLLSERDASLFLKLSVFAGGFALEGAEQVCAGDELDEFEVLDTLAELVDKSLVLAEERDGKVRYRILESLREYGEEKLRVAGNEEEIRNAHLRWYLDLAEKAEPELLSSDQLMWLDRLQDEHDNFRQSLAWSVDGNEPDIGLKLSATLRRFWEMRGFVTEGRSWLDRALSSCRDAPPDVQAKALNAAGVLAEAQGDYPRARTLYEQSLVIMRRSGDREGTARTLVNLGNTSQAQGDYRQARLLFDEGREIARELGDRRLAVPSLTGLGNIAFSQGDLATARSLWEESLKTLRELGDRQNATKMLGNLGNLSFAQGDFATARSLWEESLEIRRELGDRPGMAASLNNLGSLAWARSHYSEARSLYEQSLEILRELGDTPGIARSLNNLGSIAEGEAQYAAARSMLEESLQIRRTLGDRAGVATSLQNLGSIALVQGDYESALERLEESLEILRELGNKAGVAESLNTLGAIVFEQGDEERARTMFEESLAIGRELGNKQAVAAALYNLGRVTARLNYDGARALLNESLEILRELDNKSRVAETLNVLGRSAAALGELENAARLHREALVEIRELGDRIGIARSLEGLAGLASAVGKFEAAGRLFGAAEALREAIGSPVLLSERLDYDRNLESAIAGGGETFARARAAGRQMALQEAIELALDTAPGDD